MSVCLNKIIFQSVSIRTIFILNYIENMVIVSYRITVLL